MLSLSLCSWLRYDHNLSILFYLEMLAPFNLQGMQVNSMLLLHEYIILPFWWHVMNFDLGFGL